MIKQTLKTLQFAVMNCLILCFLLLGHTPLVSAAGSGSLSLSPASGTYNVQSTLTVTINETTTDGVNAVEADLTYDASKLQFVSIDSSGSAFGLAASSSGGGGSVTISKGNFTDVTGTNKIAAVTFTVLGGSGSTAITFASSSSLVRSSDNSNIWDGNTAGGNYTMATPSPAPTAPPTTSTNSGTTSSSTPTGGSSTTTNTSTTTAKKGSTATTKPATTTAPVVTPTAVPVDQPVVVQKDISNAGYLVAFTVTDASMHAVKGASVNIGTHTAKTDEKGLASFTGITAGSYNAKITFGKRSSQKSITVTDGDTTAVQKFAATLPNEKSSPVAPIAIALGGIIVASGAGYLIYKLIKKGAKTVALTTSYSSSNLSSETAVVTEPASSTTVVNAKESTNNPTSTPPLIQ